MIARCDDSRTLPTLSLLDTFLIGRKRPFLAGRARERALWPPPRHWAFQIYPKIAILAEHDFSSRVMSISHGPIMRLWNQQKRPPQCNRAFFLSTHEDSYTPNIEPSLKRVPQKSNRHHLLDRQPIINESTFPMIGRLRLAPFLVIQRIPGAFEASVIIFFKTPRHWLSLWLSHL